MIPIEIQSIPNNRHRYDTVGDYWDSATGTHIRTSDLGNEDFEFLVALHELVEQYLCRSRGIAEKDIMAFDVAFEQERAEGLWTDEEPGDDSRAPYRREHFFATTIERAMAHELGVTWAAYDAAISDLPPYQKEMPRGQD